ncbi:MAG: methyltransferase domain-containing protein [Oscillospiraceae bacterium]|nr:methyltransferase domain-containing protein [Oscillospiraceae bacterium]
MGLFKDFVSQTRKPEGFLGRMMLSGMNSGHAKLADWGFTHLPAITPTKAIDLGCGGGRNAGELLKKYPNAHIAAIDYSDLSVEKARDYNKDMIAAGRCTVRQGDVSNLKLPAETFDIATAFETVYFWPGLEKCFAQVEYGTTMEEIGHIMVYAYERNTLKMPGIVRAFMGKVYKSPKLLNKMLVKKDAKNAENAAANPGSFETQTQIPPESGYDFSYHNLACPLANFARKYGHEAYMPYLCNLDYVHFGLLGAPLFREHTCFEDGDYCDFKLKLNAEPLPYWPPVFSQDNPYK